jgi:leucyl aminopeptidase
VGKGVTFDSGGISLKPPANMHEMKGDMSGAAAVLGVFEALGRLAARRVPAKPVIGLLPCAENMPDGGALRPGDIITARAGKTVEIISTDAEGRLLLADALDYAQTNWRPGLLVDIATLTGACVVALGKDAAGLFCDDADLAADLLRNGEKLGERAWRLPLWEDAGKEALKSPVADMANAGPREGGAIHAAVFLKQFVRKDVRWAHLDIAATYNSESPVNAKGASGFGVRTLLETLWRA